MIDSGFGSNLPLQPVELDGPSVDSPAGLFRLRTCSTEKGSIVFQSTSDKGWQTRYAFFPEKVEWRDLDRIKREIHTSAQSAFNQRLLIAQLLPGEIISLNEERLRRKWTSGKEQRIVFSSPQEMLEAIKHHFHPSIYEAAARYVEKTK